MARVEGPSVKITRGSPGWSATSCVSRCSTRSRVRAAFSSVRPSMESPILSAWKSATPAAWRSQACRFSLYIRACHGASGSGVARIAVRTSTRGRSSSPVC